MDAREMLCLVSRTDYDNLSDEFKANIIPYYDAIQNSVKSIRLVSDCNGTIIEIMVCNSLVEETNKLLWYGLHDLINPDSTAYVEIHNFDIDGNTIDIEKYLIDNVVMSIIKHHQQNDCQSIQISGRVSAEITFEDKK